MELSEYIVIEERCRGLFTDIEGLEQRVLNLQEELHAKETSMQREISSIETNKEEYVRNSISARLYQATHSKNVERSALSLQLKQLRSTPYTPNRKKLSESLQPDIDLYTSVLTGTIKDRKENKLLFDIVKQNDAQDFTNVSYAKIKQELEKYQEGLLKTKEFKEFSIISTKFIDRIFSVATLFRFLKGWQRLVFLISYYAIVGLIIVACMPIMVCIYTFMGINFIKNNSKFRKEQIKSIRSVTFFDKLARELKARTKQRLESRVAKSMQLHVEKKAKNISDMRNHIKELEQQIAQEEKTIRDEMTAYSKTDNYEKEQQVIIKQKYQQSLDESAETLTSTEELLAEMKKEYEDLVHQRNEGKQELEDTYFKLDKCGKNKILPTQFLLGFNEYTPITMDMAEYCINLLTNQKSEDQHTSFVIMCLVQILCTTNPSCVKITIVDINNGTTNYGIFNNLPEVVSVVKTIDEFDDKLDYLFQVKADRDRDIKQKADDITDYNKLMMDNYGITLPYEILIITHHVDKLIGNQIFRQLQSAGNLGIVTISMWDNGILRYSPKYSKEYYAKFIPFMSSLNNLFYYGGGTLSPLSSMYIEDKLNDIKKALRALK